MLDFDGVLNNEAWMQDVNALRKAFGHPLRSPLDRGVDELDPDRVRLISDFCIEQNTGIVISSSWRGLMSVVVLTNILQSVGLDKEIPIIGVTPNVPNHHRGQEVLEFLDIYERWHGKRITNYVCFDDSTDYYPNQPVVYTKWEEGLLPSHIAQAKELLNRKDTVGV